MYDLRNIHIITMDTQDITQLFSPSAISLINSYVKQRVTSYIN